MLQQVWGGWSTGQRHTAALFLTQAVWEAAADVVQGWDQVIGGHTLPAATPPSKGKGKGKGKAQEDPEDPPPALPRLGDALITVAALSAGRVAVRAVGPFDSREVLEGKLGGKRSGKEKGSSDRKFEQRGVQISIQVEVGTKGKGDCVTVWWWWGGGNV